MSEDRFGIVGKVIARTYEIRDVVAEGGFGVVYRAYHSGFRAEVALKCLKIPNELNATQRAAFLEQFRAEAEVLFRLSAQSSNIVRPLHVDAFQTPDKVLVPFIALEWLEGRTLDRLIAQRRENGRPPLSLEKLVRLLTPVAQALELAHNLPGPDGPQIVIHRDMKPENLFIARINKQDIAKVLDFGISKVKGTAGQMAGKTSLNADALVSFSPAYGAPEQWAPRSYGQTGRWTDVWGLALTVVEALKGEEVIEGDHAAMMGTILDPTRRPTPRNEGLTVSDEVEKTFERALAVDPRKRYQSVGEFWDQLTFALGLSAEIGTVSLSGHALPATQNADSLDSIIPPKKPAGPELSSRHSGPIQAVNQRLAAASSTKIANKDRRAISLDTISLPPATWHSTHASQYPSGSIWKALSPSIALFLLSLALTASDRICAYYRGIPLAVGPVQASWIAGACMVLALIRAAAVLKRAMND